MQEVQINLVAEPTEDGKNLAAQIIANTGGETIADREGGIDNFIGRLPPEATSEPDLAEALIIGDQIILIEDNVTEQGLKDAVNRVLDPDSDELVTFREGQETANAIINAFNDFRNGDINEVSEQEVFDEAFG